MVQGNLQQQLTLAQRRVRRLQAKLDAAQQTLTRLEVEMGSQAAARVAERGTEPSYPHDLMVALERAMTQAAAQIDATPDLDQIFTTLGEQLNQLGIFCVVSLFDLPTQNLYIRYQSVDLQQLRQVEALAGLSMSGFQLTRANFPLLDDIVDLKQSAFVADPISLVQAILPDLSSSLHAQLLALVGMTADTTLVYLPLAVEKRVLGVMTIWGETLSTHDVEVYALFVGQVAALLEEVGLHEQARTQRLEEQDALLGLSQVLLGLTDMEQVAQATAEAVQRLLHVDVVTLLLPDNEGVNLVEVGRGENGRDRIPIATSLEGRVWQTGQVGQTAVTTTTTQTSHVIVPMRSHTGAIGVLRVSRPTRHEFSFRETRFLLLIAYQAAQALEHTSTVEATHRMLTRNAELYEASQRQLQELKVLHAIADAGAEAMHEDAIIQRATEVLAATFYPHVLGVLLLDEETGTLRAHASYHEKVGLVHMEVPLDRGVIGYVARTGQPKRVADVRQDPEYAVGDPQVMSELCVPIKVGKRVLGVLNAESAKLDAFAPEDERFLTTIAGQLATSLQRLRNEQEVRKLASAVEQTADFIYITDRRGVLKYVNPAFETLTGYTRADVLGKELTALKLGSPNEQLFLNSWEESKEVQHFRDIIINRKKTGEWYYEEKTITPLRDLQGDNTLFVHTGKDITVRMQQEQEREAILTVAAALRKAKTRAEMTSIVLQQVRSLLQADGVALAVQDAATKSSVIEQAVGSVALFAGRRIPHDQPSICGYVITHNQVVVHHPPHPLPTDSLISDVPPGMACVPLTTQQQTIGALWVSRQTVITDDEVRLLIAIADMVANAVHRATLHEQLVAQAAILEQRVGERTQELAKANEQLQALDKLKSKFVSDVSHELRTPVHNLQLYLDLLQHGKAENVERYQQVLRQQALRLRQLIENILDLSRLEMGRERIEFDLLSLNELVEPVIAAHQVQAQETGLTLQWIPGVNLPLIRGARNQLAQVVTNLVINSMKYTLTGKVVVKTYLAEAGDMVCLHVEDTGVGIDPVDRLHLFDRFYRGQHSAARDIPGTGLGLAIVKEIVDLHSGQIELESEVGQGSTFRVWFPLGVYEQEGADSI
ncbi:MAG: GAF domain-containing protein [Anaerolinea sp.]|nr:GAF domain-containing protein [Anaerolinea sp.]